MPDRLRSASDRGHLPFQPLPGIVLVGGRGRRFGSPKADAALPDGIRLLARARAALGPAAAPLFAAGTSVATHGFSPLPDDRPDEGPLSGIAAGLERAVASGAPGAVVLAVDLPRLSAPGLLTLVRRFRASTVPADTVVVAVDADGPQPLAAVWGTGALPVVRSALEDGRGRVRSVLDAVAAHERLSRVTVDAEEIAEACGHAEPLLNVNRPEDADRAVSTPVCPPLVTVQGWKNSGKTTVATALVRELTRRGYDVSAMKKGHAFELDTSGTDSHRLAEAGAGRLLLSAPDRISILGAAAPVLGTGAAALAASALAGSGIVVAEGWKAEPVPAIEVRRSDARDTAPIAEDLDRDRRLALVSDLPADLADGALHPDAPDLAARLADVVIERLGLTVDAP